MRERDIPLRPKLREAVALDFPAASEIAVSFPDQWELVQMLKCEGQASPIYVAAFPPEPQKPSRDHFYGLSQKINLSLTSYRLYKFFEAWSQPTVFVDWNAQEGEGRVSGMGKLTVQLQPMGQAQTWCGPDFAVLWECYLHEPQKQKRVWKDLLSEFWQIVEKDAGASEVFTPAHDPDFEEGYAEFLGSLGYAAVHGNPEWWSKSLLSAS